MTIDVLTLIAKINEDFSTDAAVTVGAQTELLMSGLIDSVGLVEMVSWLEDELGIEIDPGDIELERFETPSAIVAFLATSAAPARR